MAVFTAVMEKLVIYRGTIRHARIHSLIHVVSPVHFNPQCICISFSFQTTGWSSPVEGYDGMILEAKHLLSMHDDKRDAERAAVRRE